MRDEVWGARRPLFFAGIDLYRSFARLNLWQPRKNVIQCASTKL